jgi:N-acetylmuramoyl-L-alanine amidase
VFEKAGAAVAWDADAQKVSVSLNTTLIELKINSTTATVNGKAVLLDVPAKIINDRTMVPIRFIGEQLNMTVGWHPEQGLVTMDKILTAGTASLKDIQYTVNNALCDVQINLDSYQNYKTWTLTNPDRIVVDIPNTRLSSKQQTININSQYVKAVRYAQLDTATAVQAKFDSDTVRVVLDVIGQPNYGVSEKAGQLVVSVAGSGTVASRGSIDRKTADTGNKLSVSHFVKAEYDDIVMSVNDYKNYNVMQLTDKNQIIVDIPNAVLPAQLQKETINSGLVDAISYSQTANNSANITIDLNGQPQYQVIEEMGRLILRISPGSENDI